MIKLIYIIQAHKNPTQLKRLIEKLNGNNCFFYVHIDRKSNLEDFTEIISYQNVNFIKNRVKCIWGDFSLVMATINLITTVLNNHSQGFCILLSGQDYPIKSNNHIKSYLTENYGKAYINTKKVEEVWSEKECRRRTEFFRINLSDKRNQYVLLPGINILAFKLLFKGKIPLTDFHNLFFKRSLSYALYGGSYWWAFNVNTLIKIHEFIKNNESKLIKYFQYTHCADEIFFQTIIKELMSKGEKIELDNSLTYVNWFKPNTPLPVTFCEQDANDLLNQPEGKLFARKFDPHYDQKIMDILDKNI